MGTLLALRTRLSLALVLVGSNKYARSGVLAHGITQELGFI
jgi:hypothetical protein